MELSEGCKRAKSLKTHLKLSMAWNALVAFSSAFDQYCHIERVQLHSQVCAAYTY